MDSPIKVSLDELESAVKYISKNANPGFKVRVSIEDRRLYLLSFDNNDNSIEIILFDDGNLMAKVRETKVLERK